MRVRMVFKAEGLNQRVNETVSCWWLPRSLSFQDKDNRWRLGLLVQVQGPGETKGQVLVCLKGGVHIVRERVSVS